LTGGAFLWYKSKMNELTTIIRLSPNISPTCVDWVRDKFQMCKICYDSYLGAVQDFDVKEIFLLDNCPQNYTNYFSQFGQVIEMKIGNKRKTIEIMYQEALKCNSKAILFLEDDYLWRPYVSLKNLTAACHHFGAVTPYDHPQHYHGFNPNFLIKPFNGELFRHNLTTTHTFMVTKGLLQRYFDDFNYGLHDWIMWTKLQASGVNLFAPINSYATHLATNCIAYGYDFKGFYDRCVSSNI
jgi:hypothetical protein